MYISKSLEVHYKLVAYIIPLIFARDCQSTFPANQSSTVANNRRTIHRSLSCAEDTNRFRFRLRVIMSHILRAKLQGAFTEK